MAAPAGFNPSQPPPTLQDYQNEFQPTAEDINAVHGQRSAADVKVDEAAIRNMEIEEMPKPWSDPYFECQDLSQYHVLQPAVEFLRISRQYNTILSVWQKNFNFGKKIQQNPKLKLPEFARLDQAVNGDLEASNARRRRHLVGTIAYCWQLRDYIKKEKEWKRNQMERRKVIKPKKKKEKEKDKKKGKKDKNKSKTGTVWLPLNCSVCGISIHFLSDSLSLSLCFRSVSSLTVCDSAVFGVLLICGRETRGG